MGSKSKITLISTSMILLLVTLICTISYLIQMPEETISQVAKLTKESLMINDSTANGSISTKGAHDSSSFYQNGNFYCEVLSHQLNKVYIPSIGDIQLYCVEKGVALRSNKERVATIKALNGQTGTSSSGYCSAPLPAKRYSNTYYICKDNHSEMIPSGAYIVTAPSNFIAPYDGSYIYGKSSSSFKKGENISKEVRQVAMWLNMEVNVGEPFESSGAKFTYLDMAKQLKEEAFDYRDYETDLKAHVDEPFKETTEEKVKINVNQEKQYLIIGPYKMDYVEGNSSTAKFAGISKMIVKGYNDKEKQVFIKDIKIESFIQNGVEQKLKFFTPKEDEGYVDRNENNYPKSGEEFYIKIKNPNQGKLDSDDVVRYIDINVEYSYMTVYAIQCELEGHQLVASAVPTGHNHYYNKDGYFTSCRVSYMWKVTENPLPQQKMIDSWGKRNLYKLNINLNGGGDNKLDITMKLGGYVWEDAKGAKTNTADGVYYKQYNKEDDDKILPNVKVTLYECQVDVNGKVQYSNGKPVGNVADLLSNADKNQLTKNEILHRVNPTITDKNGYYEFEGLNSSNKYYVTFEYNGQIYLPTEYLVIGKDNKGNLEHSNSVEEMVFNAKLYNTAIWEANSKGIEGQDVRKEYNNKFGEIGSSPKNYISSNSLRSNELIKESREYYNETFSINDLMGYVLNEDGKYEAQEIQLIDGFYELNGEGNIVETTIISEGEISKRIKEYIERYYQYPNEENLIALYADIVEDYGKNQEQKKQLWKKLQYIEDCKINAYTGSPFKNEQIDLYPVYNDFVIDNKAMVIPGIGTKAPIYDGQFYVNLGLWRRAQNNLALRKDIYRAATKINGKTEVYEYDKRSEEDKYWEIQVRMKDYHNYYGTSYNRELYPSDYNYRAENTNLYGKELELYVTYKITIRNSSQNTLNEVTEVVDYYDKDYTYMPDLSWVMYKDSNLDDNKMISISKDAYYNMIHNLDLNQIENARDVKSSYATQINNNGTYCGQSIYGSVTQQDLETKWNSVYINGLDGKQIATGEQAYIYLTFKVNHDSEGPVILDDDNSLKQNYSEINGYRSYYTDGTKLPNEVTIKGNKELAGIVDMNSTPGNLCLNDLQGNKYEKNFEDDTDRAKGIKVLLDEQAIRKLNGIAWEDERTQNVSNSIIGDGVRQEDEIGIQGVTVELVEKLADGKEFVWQTTNTGSNKVIICDLKTGEQKEYTNTVKEGEEKYEFAEFIPGNYIVRFRYGHNKETLVTVSNGGKNAVSYNGQDFKSTVYGQDLKNNQEIANYTDEYYNIQAADSLSINGKANVSDAKDLWENKTANIGRKTNNQTTYKDEAYQGREIVNSYSTSMANHKAEVLASPYAQVQNSELLQELLNNTHMTAETAIIVAEVEYNRTNTDGYNTQSNGSDLYLYGNDKNSKYTLNNVDLGLTERPKAQLEVNKKVTNVKLTLANGNILFDSSQSVDNLVWLSGSEYNLNSKMKNSKYEEYYDESKEDNNYHRYSYRTEINKLITGLYQNGTNGLIQLTMDEELMHGATIEISYQMTVKNVGETDYTGKDFYYKGKGASEANKVTTAANLVLDYVANNLQYREADNKDWKVVKTEELTNNDLSKLNDRLVNNSLSEKLNQYNVILQTAKLDTNLKPGEQVNKDLFLIQLITPENKEDDKTYENISEIVHVSNTVGRRMAYSIVGNQDPTTTPSEVDSSKAERVIILPPFGEQYLYYVLAVATMLTVVCGIIFIKKKVINH